MELKELLVKAFKAGWKSRGENTSFNGLMLEDKYANKFADELVKICNIPIVSERFSLINTDDPKFEILFREGNWGAHDYQLTDMVRELVIQHNKLVEQLNAR